MSRMRGEDVPRSRPGAKTAWGGSSPSLAALARLGAGARYAKLWGGALSPTSRQHAYKSAVLALGLPSYPPNPQAGAHHGAIIAIPTAVRRAMHFGGRAGEFHARPAGHDPTLASWALRVGWTAGVRRDDLAARAAGARARLTK